MKYIGIFVLLFFLAGCGDKDKSFSNTQISKLKQFSDNYIVKCNCGWCGKPPKWQRFVPKDECIETFTNRYIHKDCMAQYKKEMDFNVEKIKAFIKKR